MQITALSITLGQKAMTVQIRDSAGELRRMAYEWHDASKDQCPAPPPTWPASVQGELDYQRAEELAEAQGRRTL